MTQRRRAPAGGAEVTLVDYDPAGEEKVVAAAMYAASDLPDDRLHSLAHTMSSEERAAVLAAYIGERGNRRHKPGRAFERTSYRFDVLCDYGAFRDLQRHRLLTLEWQRLTPAHGYATPAEIEEAGFADEWHRVMEDSAETWAAVEREAGADVGQYAVTMSYRIRFVMQMSAREAMHLIELRSSPQGHPTYRRVAHADARSHREHRRPPGHRRRHALRRLLRRRPRTPRSRTPGRSQAPCGCRGSRLSCGFGYPDAPDGP